MDRIKRMLKGRYFLTWILAFIGILLLPVIFGVIIYAGALNNLKDEMDTNQNQYMYQKTDQISALSQESFYRCYTALSNNAVDRYAATGDASYIPDVQLSLSRTMNVSSNYSDAFLYFPKEKTLVGTNTVTDTNDSAAAEKITSIPYDDLSAIIASPPTGTWNTFYFSEENDVAVYITTFGSNAPNAPLVLLYLNYNSFIKMLSSENGTVFVITENGGYLSSDGTSMPAEVDEAYKLVHSTTTEKVETASYYVYTRYAPKTGLYLTYAVPRSYFTDRMRPLSLALILYIVICILGGAAIAFFVTRRQMKPVNEIYELINDDSPVDKEFGAIKTHIQALLEEKEKSEYQEEQLAIVSKNVAMHALLKGRLRAIDPDPDMDLSLYGISDRYLHYILLAFEVEDLGNFMTPEKAASVSASVDYLTDLVLHLIDESYGKNYDYMAGEVDGSVVCVLNTDDDSRQGLTDIADMAKKLCDYFHDSLGIIMTANISTYCDEKNELPERYAQLRILSEFRNNIGTDKKVITFAEFDTGNELNNADIYKNESYIKSLLDDHNYADAADELKKIIKIQKNAEEGEGDSRSERSRTLSADIKEYIDNNYSDPQLSVNYIADTMGVNLSYMSRVFKNNTGKGILEYINEVRIGAACDLIDNGASLSEAANLVGYYTQRSFTRAFEKVKGMKPGEYK